MEMKSYTVKTIAHEVFELRGINTTEKITVGTTHSKWRDLCTAVCSKRGLRVLSIMPNGNWNLGNELTKL